MRPLSDMRALTSRNGPCPQHIPCDVRPKLFAAHGTRGQALNGRAMLSGHAPPFVFPLTNGSLGNAQRIRKCGFGANNLCSSVDGVFHA
jgi:hypothetical protein